jgi:energy-coupling factor transport system ATP-binding protein
LYELQKRGIPLPDGILTREELVSALGYGKTDRK